MTHRSESIHDDTASPSMSVPVPDVPFLETDGSIFAGAGSGKTSTSIALHKYARDRGKSVIMITFTNATMDDYIRRAKAVASDLASCENVFTFHKLAGLVLQDAENDDIVLSTDTIVPLAVEFLNRAGLPDPLKVTDVVLVDESQDCSAENYELVRAIGRLANATVVMIGDANQCLYRFRNASPEFLLNHRGFRHELCVNYRSSPEVVALSRQFMRHPVRATSFQRTPGPTPRLIVRKPPAAIDFILRCIQSRAVDGGAVMLIGRSKQPRYEKHRMVRMGLQTVVNEMSRRGIPFKRLFRETCTDEPMAGGQSMDTSCVNVMTIHGSKGLEADTVIVIDAIEEMINDERSPDQMELMYVAFSRPRRNLFIVNLQDAMCDRVLATCVDRGLCEIDGAVSERGMAVTRNVIQKNTVTQVLSDRTILGESALLELSRSVITSHKTVSRPDPAAADALASLPESADLCTLYGQLAENCLQMAYNASRQQQSAGALVEVNVMRRLSDFVATRLIVPRRHQSALMRLMDACGARVGDSITPEQVADIRERICASDPGYSMMTAFVDHVQAEMSQRNMDRATLLPDSVTQTIRIPELMLIVKRFAEAKCNYERLPHLFRSTLFFFQLSQHAGYRWALDYNSHIYAFRPFLARICRMARLLPDNCTFEKRVSFKHLRLTGRMDVTAPGRIIEAKFTSSLSLLHYLQPSLYALLDGGKYDKRCETWNLATGERVIVRHDDTPEGRWRMLENLAKLLDRKVAVDDMGAASENQGTFRLESGTLRICCRTTCTDTSLKWFDVGTAGLKWRATHV